MNGVTMKILIMGLPGSGKTWLGKRLGERFSIPHWDFRMIRRWIGWDGLDILLFYYNASTGFECKREYVEILDKVSLCNSREIRSFDNELFNNYINGWPDYQGTK